jgi:SNF2 family DNA or RNA helicase
MGMRMPLFPFQELAFSAFMDRGTMLLALDTGLGKTATSIAIAEDLLARRKVRSVLIVVPANLKYQWAKSLTKFTDVPSKPVKVKRKLIDIPLPEYCAIIDGTPERRQKQYELARQLKTEYIIVGYDTLVSDWTDIETLNCTLSILDEASMIKTPGAERTRAIKDRLRTPYRLALTATPIENVPEDVFSIMQWVDKTVLGRWDLFDKAYVIRSTDGAVLGYKNLNVLFDRLGTAMFRRKRTDPDVCDYLPKVEHHVWEVDTTDEILEAYVDMARDLVDAQAASAPRASTFSLAAHYGASPGTNNVGSMGQVMSIHTCMEMLLDYPPMIAESARKGGSQYAVDLIASGFVPPDATPKIDYVVDRVHVILKGDPDAKVILFSRYRGMLNVLHRDLERHGCVQYHGELTPSAKEAAIASFLEDDDVRVFISSHAGAYGTDLPVANWLVNIDLPWGDGLATQINGRHVRASSTFNVVHVVDVITRRTIEARKMEVRMFKAAIALAAIDGKTLNGRVYKDVVSLFKHARLVIEAWENSE